MPLQLWDALEDQALFLVLQCVVKLFTLKLVSIIIIDPQILSSRTSCTCTCIRFAVPSNLNVMLFAYALDVGDSYYSLKLNKINSLSLILAFIKRDPFLEDKTCLEDDISNFHDSSHESNDILHEVEKKDGRMLSRREMINCPLKRTTWMLELRGVDGERESISRIDRKLGTFLLQETWDTCLFRFLFPCFFGYSLSLCD